MRTFPTSSELKKRWGWSRFLAVYFVFGYCIYRLDNWARAPGFGCITYIGLPEDEALKERAHSEYGPVILHWWRIYDSDKEWKASKAEKLRFWGGMESQARYRLAVGTLSLIICGFLFGAMSKRKSP